MLLTDVTWPRVSVAFIRAGEAAGVEDFSIHDLRHCFASQLRINEADPDDIQILLGYSDDVAVLAPDRAHLDKTAHGLDGIYLLPPGPLKALLALRAFQTDEC